jgi:hypothetical protein
MASNDEEGELATVAGVTALDTAPRRPISIGFDLT